MNWLFSVGFKQTRNRSTDNEIRNGNATRTPTPPPPPGIWKGCQPSGIPPVNYKMKCFLYTLIALLTWNPLEDNLSLTKQRKYGMLL